MKLSDAILKGCEGTVKCRGNFIEGENKCCVIGAAIVGVLGFSRARRLVNIDFPLKWLKSNFPLLGMYDIWSEAVNRNNGTNESSESIAAWIKTVEDQEESSR